jgi:PAS domain S-box-containing protein
MIGQFKNLIKKNNNSLPNRLFSSFIKILFSKKSADNIKDLQSGLSIDEVFIDLISEIRTDDPQKYLNHFVNKINKVLQADYTFVGKVMPDKLKVKSVAISGKNGLLENFEYYLEGTPCHNVIDKQMCTYTSSITALFPNDTLLKQLEIEAYCGIPLFDSTHQPIGIMVALYTKPLKNKYFNEQIFQIFATHAGVELQRMLTEKALKQSETKYKTIFDNAPLGIFRSTPEGTFLEMNQAIANMLGYNNPDEAIQSIKNIETDIYENPSTRHNLITAALNSEKVIKFEALFKRKNGDKFLGNITLHVVKENNNIQYIDGILEDIDDRHKAELAFRESQLRYKHITESITDYIVKVYIEQGKVKETIHGAASVIITGYSPEEFNSDSYLWLKMIHPEDRKNVVDIITLIVQGNEVKPFDHRIFDKNGNIRWIRNNPVIFKNENNEIYEYDAVISDITERKVTEEALIESEHNYRLLFNQMSGGFGLHEMIYDENGNAYDYRFLEINPAYEKLTGLKRDDIVGKTILEVIPNIEKYWIETFGKVATTCEPINYVNYAQPLDRYYETSVYSPKKGYFAVIFNNITDRKKAEDALIKSEERFAMAMNATNDGLFEWNFKTNEAYFSPRNFIMLGYKPSDFEPTVLNWQTLVHTDDLQKRSLKFNEHLMGLTQTYEVDYRMKTKSGQYKWIQEKGKVIEKTSNNEPVRIVGTHTDIDDRKRFEETLKHERDFNALISQTSPVGIITADVEGNIAFANKQAEKILGICKSDIDSRKYNSPEWKITDINGNSFPIENLAFNQIKKLQKSVWGIQHAIEWPNGKRVILSVNASPLFNNDVFDGMIATVEDITDWIKNEQELISAKLKAEESDKLKSAFLANMSHEIRTPMNGIIGFAGLLEKEDLDSVKRQKYISIIQNSTNQLLTIVTDILDISKIEAGLLDIVPRNYNLNQIIDEIQTQFEVEKKFKEKYNIQLNVVKDLSNDESNVIIDKARITQIFSNLIGNALKFTYGGEIEFGYKVQNNDNLLFFVRDTGIGIPDDKKKIIFERFRQVDDSTTRKFGGAGLGLSICKGLIDLMHGKLWVESEENKGSTFYFTTPYNPVFIQNANLQNANLDAFINYYWKDYTILIVEDVEYNYTLLKEMLEETNVNILYAPDGKTSIKICENNNAIDIVLMDIQLPDITGYDATKQIRLINPDLFIIAQTAYGLAGDKEKALAAGCNDYISKPILKSYLLSLINEYIIRLKK